MRGILTFNDNKHTEYEVYIKELPYILLPLINVNISYFMPITNKNYYENFVIHKVSNDKIQLYNFQATLVIERYQKIKREQVKNKLINKIRRI